MKPSSFTMENGWVSIVSISPNHRSMIADFLVSLSHFMGERFRRLKPHINDGVLIRGTAQGRMKLFSIPMPGGAWLWRGVTSLGGAQKCRQDRLIRFLTPPSLRAHKRNNSAYNQADIGRLRQTSLLEAVIRELSSVRANLATSQRNRRS